MVYIPFLLAVEAHILVLIWLYLNILILCMYSRHESNPGATDILTNMVMVVGNFPLTSRAGPYIILLTGKGDMLVASWVHLDMLISSIARVNINLRECRRVDARSIDAIIPVSTEVLT